MNRSTVDASRPFATPQVLQKARHGEQSPSQVQVINGSPPPMPPMLGRNNKTKPAFASENMPPSSVPLQKPLPLLPPSHCSPPTEINGSPPKIVPSDSDASLKSQAPSDMSAPPGMITRYVTKTTVKNVNGKNVVEKTTVTFTEPLNKQPQGWGGRLMKKFGKNKNSGKLKPLSTREMNTALATVQEDAAQTDAEVPKVEAAVPRSKKRWSMFRKGKGKQKPSTKSALVQEAPSAANKQQSQAAATLAHQTQPVGASTSAAAPRSFQVVSVPPGLTSAEACAALLAAFPPSPAATASAAPRSPCPVPMEQAPPPVSTSSTQTSPPVLLPSDDETILEYYSVANDDAVSEYEEMTILDDQMYDVSYFEEETVLDERSYDVGSYFEEETVLDESVHQRDMMQQRGQFRNEAATSPTIKMEGMDLLMANIRQRADKVH
ncbi:expressed unknown protein [Seminavis robusta]|uniref:Uncharacterized protein n=1 Tax=Seminavis robusta TaxID=568900 RepID=A0A9N8HHN9_9STRA|nr:expressed unknown protein [Seminavis robusta]|eukprot:Sro458_g147110.1 n/a (435) ;mRNA; f:36613-37917